MALNNSNSSGSNNNLSNNNNNNNESDNTKQGNLVVRMDEDSATKLQALFDTVLKPSEQNRPLQIPLRMRKLPNSFFNPPSTGSKSPSVSHSRENSIDSAFGSGTTIVYAPGGGSGSGSGTASSVLTQRLSISHSRAHSSPATLEQTHAAGLKSVTGATGSGNSTNQNTNQTQAQAPLKAVHASQRSYDVISAIQLQDELGDLPPGWEQARTAEGQIYYLNHITRTTQWEDPRKQLAAQQALTVHQSADSLLRSQQSQQPQPPIQQNNGNPVAKLSSSSVTSDPLLGPLPEGWEQAVTSAGETYFINHINRTTSWFDPRIPEHFQRSEISRSAGGWLNIQNLQKEREYLKQRQQEIQHQTMGLQMDPFLPGVTDHTRQESGDSGLSLTSNHYSMPHTPDFLANMDDSMDCISESGNIDTSSLENTDDLVPSLQLGEGFNNDILDDVHSLMDSEVKTDSLTWI